MEETELDGSTGERGGVQAGKRGIEERKLDSPTGERAAAGTAARMEKWDGPTGAGGGEHVGVRGMEDPKRDSPKGARSGEPAGGRRMGEPNQDTSTDATAALAEEMADVEKQYYAELPDDLIYAILSKLPPCRTEHWAFSCLNHSWNSAVKAFFQKMPPQCPG